jgi:hypothetical protein
MTRYFQTTIEAAIAIHSCRFCQQHEISMSLSFFFFAHLSGLGRLEVKVEIFSRCIRHEEATTLNGMT